LSLGISYGLRAADAVHLATAIEVGAEQFLTKNTKDVPKAFSEIDMRYPENL